MLVVKLLLSWKGECHTAAVCVESGEVFVCGADQFGQIAKEMDGSEEEIEWECSEMEETVYPTLAKVLELVGIVAVSCGRFHTICLDYGGKMWSFGRNQHGQLGVGDTNNRYSPVCVQNVPEISALSCGASHNLCIDTSNNAWGFGKNSFGQLGTGDLQNQMAPVIIPEMSNAASVDCGGRYSFIKTSEGKFYCCGRNSEGQLGLGSRETKVKTFTLFPSQLEEANVTSIACGYAHTVILTSQGTVYTTGYNSGGQLGVGDLTTRISPERVPNLPEIRSVHVGFERSMCVDVEGNLWVCGSNEGGDLGIRSLDRCNEFVKNDNFDCVQAVSRGGDHCFVKDKNGTWAFGVSEFGQLGVGRESTNNTHPIKCPALFDSLWRIQSTQKSAKK